MKQEQIGILSASLLFLFCSGCGLLTRDSLKAPSPDGTSRFRVFCKDPGFQSDVETCSTVIEKGSSQMAIWPLEDRRGPEMGLGFLEAVWSPANGKACLLTVTGRKDILTVFAFDLSKKDVLLLSDAKPCHAPLISAMRKRYGRFGMEPGKINFDWTSTPEAWTFWMTEFSPNGANKGIELPPISEHF